MIMRAVKNLNKKLFALCWLSFIFCLPACSVTDAITETFSASIASGILNQEDPHFIEQGLPAYILLMDGMIMENPDNPLLLSAGAKLYSAYATFVSGDDVQRKNMISKARRYSVKALCLTEQEWCEIDSQPFEKYNEFIKEVSDDEIDLLYTYGATWVSEIESQRENWNAVADLPKVKATMERVLELDEQHENGGAHLYLGVMETLIPPALGGKPDSAKSHFERVIDITKGRNLMAKVLYAERYARLLYNRDLHDRLLNEVIAQKPKERNLTLINTIAQHRAKDLLKTADDYF